MSDEHKTFKSKTIELFGSEFEVSHKANNVINNNFLVYLGLGKYYLKKAHKYTISPIINGFNYLQSYGLFEPLLFLFLMYLVTVLILIIPTTFAQIDYLVDNCFTGCDLIDKYCSHLKNNEWSIVKVCIRQNISFFQVASRELAIIANWTLYLLGRLFIFICVIAIIINVCALIFYGLEWLYNKIYKKVQEINEQIPEIQEV